MPDDSIVRRSCSTSSRGASLGPTACTSRLGLCLPLCLPAFLSLPVHQHQLRAHTYVLYVRARLYADLSTTSSSSAREGSDIRALVMVSRVRFFRIGFCFLSVIVLVYVCFRVTRRPAKRVKAKHTEPESESESESKKIKEKSTKETYEELAKRS